MQRPVHRVRIEPDGIDLDVKDGQTVFRVANEAGLRWPTVCGGAMQCTMCMMVVTEGAEHLSPADADETFRTSAWIRKLQLDSTRLRLACAARVRGPVVVEPRNALGQGLPE